MKSDGYSGVNRQRSERTIHFFIIDFLLFNLPYYHTVNSKRSQWGGPINIILHNSQTQLGHMVCIESCAHSIKLITRLSLCTRLLVWPLGRARFNNTSIINITSTFYLYFLIIMIKLIIECGSPSSSTFGEKYLGWMKWDSHFLATIPFFLN